MVHIHHPSQASPDQPTFLAVGVFDGVHIGHQTLLQQMTAEARAVQARPAVLTFFPHPQVVIQGLTGRFYLSTLADRVQQLGGCGLELIIAQTFDDDVRQLRAAEFIHQLQAQLNLVQIWSGDFGLGYKREGTADFLRQLPTARPLVVREFNQLVHLDQERVSSTRIRQMITAGEVAAAHKMLGRPFAFTGTVQLGDQRGRLLNFPTANLAVWEQLVIPAHGVYATYAWVQGQRYPAATNIGVRPTVDGHNLRIEAHLLDFAGDLYGQEVTLEFVERIRPEQKFAGLEQLKSQIAADVAQVRQLLGA